MSQTGFSLTFSVFPFLTFHRSISFISNVFASNITDSQLFVVSLQEKKGKEYYDTVDILSERLADGRADLYGVSAGAGRKAENRISAGIEIIAASREGQHAAGAAKGNESKLRLGRASTEKAIEEWAKAHGALYSEEDIARRSKDGAPVAEGGEAVVYMSEDASSVTKLVDPYQRNKGSVQLCMENTRLFNELFPETAYEVTGVARDRNGKFRIVMEQPFVSGRMYDAESMKAYEDGPSQTKDRLMEELGLHDVYGDGLEWKNDKYYVADLHYGNVVFDKDGKPHIIDADVRYYGEYRRKNIEGKAIVQDKPGYKQSNQKQEDSGSSEELFASLREKEGKDYYDTVMELARRMAEGAGETSRTEEAERNVPEGQGDQRETSVGRNKHGRVKRYKSVAHCAAEIIATDTGRNKGNGFTSESSTGMERGQEDTGTYSASSASVETSAAGISTVGVASPVEREISKRVEDWAKRTHNWLNWRTLGAKYDRSKRLGTGEEAESDVFLSKDGKSVLKIVRSPHSTYDTLLGKLNGIALQNSLFADDMQNVIGMTRVHEEGWATTGLVLEQPYVKGKTVGETFDSYKEVEAHIVSFMKSLGFKTEWYMEKDGDFKGVKFDVWRKDDIIVNDVHGNNIIIDADGKNHVIDCLAYDIKEWLKKNEPYRDNDTSASASPLEGMERAAAKYREERGEGGRPHWASVGLTEPGGDGGRNGRNESDADKVQERIVAAVEKAAQKTGANVNVVRSVDEIKDGRVRRDIESGRKVTGWYDEKTGEVHLYMPNIHDSYTAEKTVWHETVGHKGMRGLLGDKMDGYMRGLWMDLDNPVNKELREYVRERMNSDHLGFYDAIEEFIAKSAEDGRGEPGFWNYIKNKVTDALREIGYRVSPNVKDVKYMLWLAKNVQKHGGDPWWKLRAEAVRWKIEHERTEYTKIHGGEIYDNDGEKHDFEGMSREEWKAATDGEIHYRTAPSAATALDRYHRQLDRHGYMATEAFMDNMLSLKHLMAAIDPRAKKVEDVAASMNPYLMQNITEGKMAMKSERFREDYMVPLDKAMAGVLDSFDGKTDDERIRSFNLYMIRKHGLERNRVLYVRDKAKKLAKTDEKAADKLRADWDMEKTALGTELRNGNTDLKTYYEKLDEWIRQNVDAEYKAEEHDYSGMHGLQEIDDTALPYDDAGAIDEVMSQEAKMEGMKKGSVNDFWAKVKRATSYSVLSDYESGLTSKETKDRVTGMFDWYVPLRKYDEATAEDVYGYVTELGNPANSIGDTLMSAKGRKSLSNVEILAQIGLMGNRAIRNGGQNEIKQAFARFVRNSGEQNLVKETKVWAVKAGTDAEGNDMWEEAYPQIPDGASADKVSRIVDKFESDMKAKAERGEAKSLSAGTDIGFKFQRARDKSQHFVDVKIAGRTHRFVVMGNPRAAQAVNGLLENGKASKAGKWLQNTTRWMAMCTTSWSPEFVMRNIMRDAEFAASHVAAKEGARYAAKWARYYAELSPLNVMHNDGAGALKGMKWRDLKNSLGFGLYARYREGTLGHTKMEQRFREFMENGGETGFVQLHSMADMEKDYKSMVKRANAKGLKKGMVAAQDVVSGFFGAVESLNEVAENMARFATFCASRDMGRSAARSAYDAKEVSTNFNRHGSGDAVWSFKDGDMGTAARVRRAMYGGVAGYLRRYSMFFNAGIQSTNLLLKNVKHAPVGTIAGMMATPFALGLMAALVNNWRIANEDEQERGGVKDPYGELPDYIRRNSLCLYMGKGRFATIPLSIELRAFYGLGDLVAGKTMAGNIESQRNMAMDAVGCLSQLLPVVDFLNDANFDKSAENMRNAVLKAAAPTPLTAGVEWAVNSDWKGAPIRRTGDNAELNPAWMNAYSNTPAYLMGINKKANALTNDMDPGNQEMKGNEWADMLTDPSMINHFFGAYTGGAGTFVERTLGGMTKTAKGEKHETGDIPFVRSLWYTPREQSGMARTKAKWYAYKEEMEQATANYARLRAKNVPLTKRIENIAALEKLEGSNTARKIAVIKDAEKRMRKWTTMRKRWADDKAQVDIANQNIELIMQEAVEEMENVELGVRN